MKKQIIVTYYWDVDDDISYEIKEILEEEAERRIKQAMSEGFTSGDLSRCVDDVEYHGYWEMTTKTL